MEVSMRRKFALWFVRFIFYLVARVQVEGLDYEIPPGGLIIVSNHLGRLDVPLVYIFLKRDDVTVMAAEKYRKYAIVRWFVKQLDAVWVDRYNADFGVLRVCLDRLRRGGVIVIAPEGTRSKTESLLEARPGSSYLAAKAGVPVIPIGITGTEDRLVMAGLRRLKKARVHAQVGKPFTLPPLKGKEREEAMKMYTDEIMCQIAALLPPEKRGFYDEHPRLKELLEEKKKA
jgi:1-acyl-sn-glycerol-3-phosphate acyltransferase